VRWKLTKDATTGETEVDEWGEGDCRRFGRQPPVSWLALLAEDPRNELVEIAPGMYEGRKVP
jgi:hypothetical protein